LKRHAVLGVRWLRCGWRLCWRHPWTLGGMGCGCALVIGVLTLIPLVGRPVIALLAPIFLAGALLALDALTQQKTPLPASLRLTAFKRAPAELLGVFRNEERVVPILLVSLCCLTVVLLIDTLALLVVGSAWSKPWGGLDLAPFLGVLVATLVALAVYFLLAIALVYALPLTFLQDQPLVPALRRSLKAGAHYRFALAAVLGLLLVPGVIGAVIPAAAIWPARLLQLVVNAAVLPLVVASLYCSYRTVFPPPGSAANRLPDNA